MVLLLSHSLLLTSDALLPHELPPHAVRALVEQLETVEGLKRAWLVRKKTMRYADVPLYVLALQGPTGWWRFEHDSSGSDLVALVNQRVAFPGETLIIAVQGANRSFRSAFKRVSGALVLDRK